MWDFPQFCCDWPHHSKWTRYLSIPHEYTLFERTHTHTFGQERSLSLFISGNPQLCPITQKIKSKISFSFSFSLYIYISSHSFPSRCLFLFPSLGSCELADVDYSINSLFIHLSVHPSIDSSLLFQLRADKQSVRGNERKSQRDLSPRPMGSFKINALTTRKSMRSNKDASCFCQNN